MRSIFLLIFFGFSLLSYANESVVIPNSDALGQAITSANLSLISHSNFSAKNPKEIRLVVTNGVIDEVQAIYNKDVSVEEIAASINSRFTDSELKNLRAADFGLWKVGGKRIVIQLSVFKGDDLSISKGDRLLILTRMSNPNSK